MEEVWRPVVGLESLYEMSTRGCVKSVDHYVKHWRGGLKLVKGRILKQTRRENGYLQVELFNNGFGKNYLVHRLVGMTFPDLVGWTEKAKGKPFDELQINHKDQNKENNCVENLEWCDGPYNANYGDRNERMAKTQTNGKCSKTVYQYTLDGQLVKVWPSIAECRRNGFVGISVCKCCLGKQNTHRGFKWSY